MAPRTRPKCRAWSPEDLREPRRDLRHLPGLQHHPDRGEQQRDQRPRHRRERGGSNRGEVHRQRLGYPEDEVGSTETTYDTEYFDHPGIAITAPSGDSGYGTIEYPAASQYVTAVGGTVLTSGTSGSRNWTETVWSQSGSGCSLYEPKPSWQTDTGCSGRTLNDVAAATNIAYYDSPTVGGWGTSDSTVASAAIIAATYALAGNPAPGSYPASYMYTHPGAFWRITGSNGTCSTSYLCTAGN